ncbi:MAG TPA: VWA domain-containing protein [Thermoanaerobaculia bacterium]|nr:VWA domain-containing protein [Thermoanaerobaculia bacterium]
MRRTSWKSAPQGISPGSAAPAAVLAAALAALSTFASSPLGAQRQLPGFAEVVDVRVVNVEVVVTDRQSNRVRGLDRDDFELIVDGQPVPIDYFAEIAEGRVVGDGEAPTAGQIAGVPALGGDRALVTNYLVFVDDSFANAQDRDRVIDRIQEQLAGLPARDRVAVVAFDGRKLDLLQSWTSDRAELAAAFAEAKRRPTFGQLRLAELRTNDSQRTERRDLDLILLERIQAQGGQEPERPFFRSRLDPVEIDYANRLTDQLDRSVLAAVSALRSFAGPTGRKTMILLSGGWPYSPSEYTVNGFSATPVDLAGAALDPSSRGRDAIFARLTDTANLLGYTLYPVDLPGQDRDIGLVDVSQSRGDFERFGPAVGAGGAVPARELQVHASLEFLADQTGGRALINFERDDALVEAIQDTRTFYWLGFTPQRSEDDARHEIEVRVRGDGLQARSRSGYVDLSRDAELDMMVESALLFGDPPSTKPLLLRFGRPQRAGLGKMAVPLEVGIPMDEITLIANAGRYVNELEIRITVMDEKSGNRSETSFDTIPISGERPPTPGMLFWYETDLQIRRKDHRIVVAVYDPLTGAILSSSGEIEG